MKRFNKSLLGNIWLPSVGVKALPWRRPKSQKNKESGLTEAG
jgi:hypothetical protein